MAGSTELYLKCLRDQGKVDLMLRLILLLAAVPILSLQHAEAAAPKSEATAKSAAPKSEATARFESAQGEIAGFAAGCVQDVGGQAAHGLKSRTKGRQLQPKRGLGRLYVTPSLICRQRCPMKPTPAT